MPFRPNDLGALGALGELLSVQLRRVDLLLIETFHQRNVRAEFIVCLAVIANNPGMSQNEIAKLIRRDASAVVGIVNQLEQNGWARRQSSAADRRKHELYVTPSGEAELARLTVELREAERQFLAALAPQEVAFLAYLLDKVHASCRQVRGVGEPRPAGPE